MNGIIRRLEHYLKVDIAYLASGGFWITLGQVVSSGASFILALAFANLLLPEQYGVYRYVLAAAALLAIPTLSGINAALTQAVAAGKEETLFVSWKVKFWFGLLGSLASLGASAYYLLNDNTVLSASFLVVALFLPFMEAYSLYTSFLTGRKDFRSNSVIHALIQIVAAAGVIGVLFITKNVVFLVLAYFAFWTLGRMAAWYFVRAALPPPQGGTDPRTIGYGKHMSTMGILGTVSQYIDRVVLFQYLGGAEVALYSIGIAMPEQIRALCKGAFELLLPRFSTQTSDSIRAGIWRKFWLMTAGLIAFTLAYVALAPYLFAIFFPLYESAVWYSQIFALSLVTLSAGVFTTALQARHETRKLYVINTLGPIIQIAMILAGIFYFGIIGAFVFRVIARFITAGITMLLYELTPDYAV